MPKLNRNTSLFSRKLLIITLVGFLTSCKKLADIFPKNNANAIVGTYEGTSLEFGGQSVPLPFTSGAQVLEVKFVLTKIDNDNVKFDFTTIETINKVKTEESDSIEKLTIEKKSKNEYALLDNGSEIATVLGSELTYSVDFEGVSASIKAKKK